MTVIDLNARRKPVTDAATTPQEGAMQSVNQVGATTFMMQELKVLFREAFGRDDELAKRNADMKLRNRQML